MSAYADELYAALRERRTVPPLMSRDASLTIDDAYLIQLAQVAAWRQAGQRVLGHKVGLTSAAMQRQLGVDRPDFGHLVDDMFFAENAPISAERFLQPRIEPEVAFVLGRPLSGPGVTVAAAVAAVDFVLPALEVIDSRIADWRIGIVDTIAERIMTLGGISVAMAHDVAETTTIPRPPKGREEAPVQISRLLEAHEITLRAARSMAKQASEAGDDGTNDLLVSDVIRPNEMQVWFLAEHLVDVPLVRANNVASS